MFIVLLIDDWEMLLSRRFAVCDLHGGRCQKQETCNVFGLEGNLSDEGTGLSAAWYGHFMVVLCIVPWSD